MNIHCRMDPYLATLGTAISQKIADPCLESPDSHHPLHHHYTVIITTNKASEPKNGSNPH